jgi:PPOX class probable F420-dependent enzyme
MTDDEVRVFLTDGTRTAKLATTRANGDPHVAPVWFVVDDDGTIVFNTGIDTVKGRNIHRNPRVSLCVDDETPPFSFVVIDGTAEISEDPDELRTTASRIGGRYMGEDRAEEYGRRNGVPGELIVRVRPTRITSAKDLAE